MQPDPPPTGVLAGLVEAAAKRLFWSAASA
jgi:hypothetical protein